MNGPTPRPGHNEAFEELAVGWALHALEPEDADAFGPHLDGCARCRTVVEETTEVMAAMAATAPSAEPPPALAERLRAEVARTPQETPSTAAGRGTAPGGARLAAAPAGPPAVVPPAVLPAQRRRWVQALVAAAVAAVVGLGGWNVVLAGDRDEARQVAASEAALLEELLRPGPATVVPVADDDGRTVATLVAREDRVQLVAQGLAANDPDAETYVLWGLGDGAPQALGTFDVTEPGLQLSTLGVEDADGFPGYGISIEPGRQAPEAPTDVVADGALPR